MKRLVFGISIGMIVGSMLPIYVWIPPSCYSWSDDYGGDGCGMCPWHDDPEETRDREEKEKDKRNNGRCGSGEDPDTRQDAPGVHH